MLKTLAIAALLSAPMQYQVRTFSDETDDEGVHSGALSSPQASCVEARLAEIGFDLSASAVLGVNYVRNDNVRTEACVNVTVEASEPIADFVLRETEPSRVRFSSDGTLAYYRTRLDRICSPRGQVVALAACVDEFLQAPGQVTQLSITRSSSASDMVLRYAWELASAEPQQYAVDRRDGIARSHVREFLPEPEPEPVVGAP